MVFQGCVIAGDEIATTSTAAYPNPAGEQISIAFAQPPNAASIEIVKALGTVVLQASITPDTRIVTIGLQHVPVGTYRVRVICQCVSERTVETHRVVVVR